MRRCANCVRIFPTPVATRVTRFGCAPPPLPCAAPCLFSRARPVLRVCAIRHAHRTRRKRLHANGESRGREGRPLPFSWRREGARNGGWGGRAGGPYANDAGRRARTRVEHGPPIAHKPNGIRPEAWVHTSPLLSLACINNLHLPSTCSYLRSPV